MLIINNLQMSYGGRDLFRNVSINLSPRQRYGIVGANGSGKSTFLRVVSGEEQPSFGSVDVANRGKIGFLKQDQYKYEQEIILNVVLRGRAELWEALEGKRILLDKDDLSPEEGMQLANYEHVIADNDGYTAETTCSHILVGLGIPEEQHYETMSTISGGFKLRVLLAQVLFSNPDILLLDEPTNHLDIVAIKWLESYLQQDYKGVLIIVSHDHNFLNNLSTCILDVDYETITAYTGNYDQFVAAKSLTSEQQVMARKQQEKQIAHMQEFVDKFKAKASKARQAQSRMKMIDKVEVTEVANSSRKAPYFSFEIKRPSGKQVLEVKSISKSFGDKSVLNKINFNVTRGEKIGIIGKNGIGKSTLLKILLDKVKGDEADFNWGYETQIGYFAQDHHELLKERVSVHEWLLEHAPSDVSSVEVRSALGNMLFTKDSVDKTITNLSGGEAARVLFANIKLARGNVLVLDEPTNHLDMESIDALADALVKYSGTVLVVSHDRNFLNKVCSRIIMLDSSKTYDYELTHGLDVDKICAKHFASEFV